MPSAEAFAQGIVDVANAVMEKAIRVISVERGHDPRDYTLVAFGGAGALHACELAEALEIPRVLVPCFPGALSALGILRADVTKDLSRTVRLEIESATDAKAETSASIRRIGTGRPQTNARRGIFQRRRSNPPFSRHALRWAILRIERSIRRKFHLCLPSRPRKALRIFRPHSRVRGGEHSRALHWPHAETQFAEIDARRPERSASNCFQLPGAIPRTP